MSLLSQPKYHYDPQNLTNILFSKIMHNNLFIDLVSLHIFSASNLQDQNTF